MVDVGTNNIGKAKNEVMNYQYEELGTKLRSRSHLQTVNVQITLEKLMWFMD